MIISDLVKDYDNNILKLGKTYTSGIKTSTSANGYWYRMHEIRIDGVKRLYQAIRLAESKCGAVINGTLLGESGNEYRRTSESDFIEQKQNWCYLDIDGYELPESMWSCDFETKLDYFLLGLPTFSFCSCVVHHSSSSELDKRKLNCHLFFLLDKPMKIDVFKHNVRCELKEAGCDLASFNKAGLCFVAPPTFVECKDPVKERVYIRHGSIDCIDTSSYKEPERTVESLREVDVESEFLINCRRRAIDRFVSQVGAGNRDFMSWKLALELFKTGMSYSEVEYTMIRHQYLMADHCPRYKTKSAFKKWVQDGRELFKPREERTTKEIANAILAKW